MNQKKLLITTKNEYLLKSSDLYSIYIHPLAFTKLLGILLNSEYRQEIITLNLTFRFIIHIKSDEEL